MAITLRPDHQQRFPEAIDTKIQQGIAELDRGEGIPEDELDAYLDKPKPQPE
jgi:hypothetical protein